MSLGSSGADGGGPRTVAAACAAESPRGAQAFSTCGPQPPADPRTARVRNPCGPTEDHPQRGPAQFEHTVFKRPPCSAVCPAPHTPPARASEQSFLGAGALPTRNQPTGHSWAGGPQSSAPAASLAEVYVELRIKVKETLDPLDRCSG